MNPSPLFLKRTLSVVLLAAAWHGSASAIIAIRVVSQDSRSTVLRLSVGAPSLLRTATPAGDFLRFDASSASVLLADGGAVGKPELPVSGFALALPLDLSDAARVQVQPEGTVRTLNARLYPVQPPDSSSTENRLPPPFQFDPAEYSRGGAQRGALLDRQTLFKGDANIENLRFMPYGYDPASGQLSWHDSYLITVSHAAGGCFVADHLADPDTRASFDAVDRVLERRAIPTLRWAINQDQLTRTCIPHRPVPVQPNGSRFIIVTHPNFVAAAQTLAQHKQNLGISTQVVTTAQISGVGAAAASARQIRDWLKTAWEGKAVKPHWVLLMGDAEFLPTHYDEVNGWNPARNGGDAWYGQVAPGSTPTTVPVFGIGRFPVDTLAQAQSIVSKVIAYETMPPLDPAVGPDFYNRLTFASYFESYDTVDTRWFVEVTEQIRDHAVGLGYGVRRIYNTEPGANPTTYRSGKPLPAALRRPGFGWNGSKQDILNAINAGSALVYHRDHGGPTGWGDPLFQTTDLAGVSVTGNRFPVIFSINCASGVFDNETVNNPENIVSGGWSVNPNSTYWVEEFLRKPDGALAVIGDTRNSSTKTNGHLAIGLFDAIFPGLSPGFGSMEAVRRLGDVLNHGFAYMAAVDNGSTANLHPSDQGVPVPVGNLRAQINIFNLIGDPTVKLRTSAPVGFAQLGLAALPQGVLVSVGLQNCPGCDPKPAVPELTPAVAFDPATGRELGRALVDSGGRATIPLGNWTGNYWVRVSSPDGTTTQAAAVETDTDRDGTPDSRDNCIAVANANQRDSDSDGFGDACDADIDNDGIVNSVDLAQLRAAYGTSGVRRADINGDGVVNALDLALLRQRFAQRPGPSAWRR